MKIFVDSDITEKSKDNKKKKKKKPDNKSQFIFKWAKNE